MKTMAGKREAMPADGKPGAGAKLVCFGLPLLCTLAAAHWLFAIGV